MASLGSQQILSWNRLGAFRPLPFCPLLKGGWSPLPISAGASGPRFCPRGGCPALDRAGSRCGLRGAPWAYTPPESGLCSLKGPEQRRRWRRRRGRRHAEDARLGTKLDGAPRSGGPPPAPPRPPPPGLSPRRSAKFRVGPPEGARGLRRGGSGEPGKGCGRSIPPRGLRLGSEGRMRGRGIRTQGRRTLGRAGFRGLNSPGFGVERSQAPERLGCRPPGPSPRPPFPPPASSREGAAPGSRVGRVSGPWPSVTPG